MLILISGTFSSLSFFTVQPMVAKYAVGIGASLSAAGTIAGLFAITALIVRPVSGLFADRFNRKRLALISACAMCLAVLLYAASASLPMLTVARIMHGASFAFNGTVLVTIVASIVPRSRLGEGIGYQGLGHILATALGPNIGIIVSDGYGYRPVFLVSAGLLAATLTVMLFFPDIPAQQSGDKKTFSIGNLISVKLLPLAVIGGFFSFLNGTVSSFLVLLGDERGIASIGVYFAVNAACLLVIRPLAGRLADRYGLKLILYPCLILVAAAAALLGSAASIGVVIAASVLIAAGQGAGQPSIQAASIKMLPASQSGLAASTFYIGADIGQGIGPVIGGAVTEMWGYGAMFYLCAALMLLGMLIFRLYSSRVTPVGDCPR